jgi:large subunit ribosomal protein L19e
MSVNQRITVKRLAASILKVGENRIRIKPDEVGRAMDALTREDVRGLIEEGVVYSLRYVGPRTKPRRKRKRAGSRKGTKYSRKGAKEGWMEKVRSQRKYLTELLASGDLTPKFKREVYLKIKGGVFKGKNALRIYLADNGMLKEGAAAATSVVRSPAPAKKEAKPAQAKQQAQKAAPAGAGKPVKKAEQKKEKK